MSTLIDTHSHLDDDRFASDLPAVLARAAATGVVRVLTIGIDLATSTAAVTLARQYPQLSAVVGIQPNHVAEADPNDWDAIVALAEAGTPVVAVGESGLDRYWDKAPLPMQEEYFDRHLTLARRLNLPIVIHCRDADQDVVRVLRSAFDQHGPIRGVLHSYTGPLDSAQACLAMGLHVSFAGMLTYKNADALRRVAAAIPHDRLLVETDSPYLTPVPFRGQRNEPAHVIHTAECLAKLHGRSLDEMASITARNARSLFQI